MTTISLIGILGIIFMIFVAPVWIFFNYLGKARSSKMLTNEDEKMLEDLWRMSQKMETRIDSLETILKSEIKR